MEAARPAGEIGRRGDIRAGVESPAFLARCRIDAMKDAVEIADIDRAVGDARRRFDRARFVTPFLFTGLQVKLTWNAPGDDGNIGQASGYTINQALYPSTTFNPLPAPPPVS